MYVRDLTEQRIDPLGVNLILLGGSKTNAAPADEWAVFEIPPRYEQIFESKRCVAPDCGLFSCLSGKLTQKPPWQLAWAYTREFPK